MSKLHGGYGLGSPYMTGQHLASHPLPLAPPRPSAYTPPAPDPTHICGPLVVSTGSPLTCTVCGKAQPGTFSAICRGGHR